VGVTTAASGPTAVRTPLEQVLAEIRESSRRRAAGHFVDDGGVLGVTEGVAPVLWITAGAQPLSVVRVAAGAADQCEIYVEQTAGDTLAALVDAGWSIADESEHVVYDGGVPPLVAVPDGFTLRECTDPAVVPAVRDLIVDAFDAPRDRIEAAYPDDFFERAAPARLILAETVDGKLAGVVGRRRQHDSAMLFALAVAARHRGSQLGSALARRATADALRDGATFVHATVDRPGSALARSVGFTPVAHWMRLSRKGS
jgi:GNAT superfamily N-acetyltransferase